MAARKAEAMVGKQVFIDADQKRPERRKGVPAAGETYDAELAKRLAHDAQARLELAAAIATRHKIEPKDALADDRVDRANQDRRRLDQLRDRRLGVPRGQSLSQQGEQVAMGTYGHQDIACEQYPYGVPRRCVCGCQLVERST